MVYAVKNKELSILQLSHTTCKMNEDFIYVASS
jgi:hypothetical protein